jgi:hypothetical protein
MLQGTFPVRIVVEGDGNKLEEIEQLVKLIDRQIALGTLGHLPIGGHKTRGAGAGIWQAKPWINDDVKKARDWTLPKEPEEQTTNGARSKRSFIDCPVAADTWVRTTNGVVTEPLTLGTTTKLAKAAIGEKLVAWWCDPTINLDLHTPPATFGTLWPSEDDKLQVDEVAFYAERAVWRTVRTSRGARFMHIEETTQATDTKTRVVHTPARLHGFQRFSSANTGQGYVLLREWHVGDEILGFTLTKEQR